MTQDSVETLKFNRDWGLIISRHIKKLRNLHPRSLNLQIPKFWHQKHLYNLLPSDGAHREMYVQDDASKQTPLWNIIKKRNLISNIANIVMRKYNYEFEKLNNIKSFSLCLEYCWYFMLNKMYWRSKTFLFYMLGKGGKNKQMHIQLTTLLHHLKR